MENYYPFSAQLTDLALQRIDGVRVAHRVVNAGMKTESVLEREREEEGRKANIR